MTDISSGVATTPEQKEEENVVEATGASVEEAVAAALVQLGVSRDDVEVQVVSSGAHAAPGERLSGNDARVRVFRIDEHSAKARALLEELLTRMEVPCRVSVRRGGMSASGAPPPVILDISGDDLGLLIGWRGETLRALQTALNLMLGEDDNALRRRSMPNLHERSMCCAWRSNHC